MSQPTDTTTAIASLKNALFYLSRIEHREDWFNRLESEIRKGLPALEMLQQSQTDRGILEAVNG